MHNLGKIGNYEHKYQSSSFPGYLVFKVALNDKMKIILTEGP